MIKNSEGPKSPLMTHQKDMIVIDKIKKGDINSYKYLIDKYEKPLFVMVMNLIKHRETAEDIAQDAFFSAYMGLDKFDPGRAKFSTWLFRLARNRSFNELKKKKESPITDTDEHISKRKTHNTKPFCGAGFIDGRHRAWPYLLR
jgi:RNA polymerase sigma-70 factor, ECF subfamily